MQPPTDDVCPDWPSNVKDVATPESWAWVVLRSQSDDHCNQECEPPPSKPGDLNIYRRHSSTLTGQTLFEPQRFRCFSPYSCVTLTFPAEIPRRSRTDRPTWQAQWASTSVTSPLLTEGAIKQYASAFSLLGGGLGGRAASCPSTRTTNHPGRNGSQGRTLREDLARRRPRPRRRSARVVGRARVACWPRRRSWSPRRRCRARAASATR